MTVDCYNATPVGVLYLHECPCSNPPREYGHVGGLYPCVEAGCGKEDAGYYQVVEGWVFCVGEHVPQEGVCWDVQCNCCDEDLFFYRWY